MPARWVSRTQTRTRDKHMLILLAYDKYSGTNIFETNSQKFSGGSQSTLT